ncbi:MAG: hypothetical protein SWH61_07700 [Thermodesulfobacteriota bacterium]|nr:hypothetical protein [Thermodesulfobacteriota bacterium]
MAAKKDSKDQKPDKTNADVDPLEETDEDLEILELSESTLMVDPIGEEETVDLSDVVGGNESEGDFIEAAENDDMSAALESDVAVDDDILDLTEEVPAAADAQDDVIDLTEPAYEEDDELLKMTEDTLISEDEATYRMDTNDDDEDILELTDTVSEDDDDDVIELTEAFEETRDDDDILDLTEEVDADAEADILELTDAVETDEQDDILELTEEADSESEDDILDLTEEAAAEADELESEDDILDLTEMLDEAPAAKADADTRETDDIVDLTETVDQEKEPAIEDDVIDLTQAADDEEESMAIAEATEAAGEDTSGFAAMREDVAFDESTDAASATAETPVPEDPQMMDFADTVELSDIVDDDLPQRGDGSLRELRETGPAPVDAGLNDNEMEDDGEDVLDEDSLVTDYEDEEETEESAEFSNSLETELETALDSSDEIKVGESEKISVHVRNRREVDGPEGFNSESMEAWQERLLKNMAATGVPGQITDEQLESALVKAIKEVYAEKLEKIIEDVVEKTIVAEIEKLKKLVYGGGEQ